MAGINERTRLDKAYLDCCIDPVNGILAIVANLDVVAGLDTYRGLFAPCWVALADELFQRAEENTTTDADALAFADNYDWVYTVTDKLREINHYADGRPSLIHLLAIPAIASSERSLLTLGDLDARYDEDREPADLTSFIVKKELLVNGTIPASNETIASVINFVVKSSPILGKAIISFLTQLHWAAYIPTTTRRLNIEFSFAPPTSKPPSDFSGVRYVSSPYIGRLHVIDDADDVPFPERLHFESLLYLIVDLPFNSRHEILGPFENEDTNEIDAWSDALIKKFGIHLVLASDVLRRVRGPIVKKYYGGSYNKLLNTLLNDPEFIDIQGLDQRSFYTSRFTAGGSYGPLEKVLASLFYDLEHGDDVTYEETGLFIRDIFLATAFYFQEIGYQQQSKAIADLNLIIPANAHKRGQRMNEMAQITAENAVHNVVRTDPRDLDAVARLKEWVNSAKHGLGVNIFNLKTSAVIDGEPTLLTPLEWIGTLEFPSVREYIEAFRYALIKSSKFGKPRPNVMLKAWTPEAKQAWLVVDQVVERYPTVSDSVDEMFERRRV